MFSKSPTFISLFILNPSQLSNIDIDCIVVGILWLIGRCGEDETSSNECGIPDSAGISNVIDGKINGATFGGGKIQFSYNSLNTGKYAQSAAKGENNDGGRGIYQSSGEIRSISNIGYDDVIVPIGYINDDCEQSNSDLDD
ncbi:MAG: hypothetical protein EZS28_016439 [Streblomastix strix]|uniref:Uncharacterized protein n=1 Tax=Streblomastix strix TaxID=222440 RepID=A0A5J4VZN0_9EUKA|nr:MAG: hypothetical protein EZS28_016439 [Streblomastix strix]